MGCALLALPAHAAAPDADEPITRLVVRASAGVSDAEAIQSLRDEVRARLGQQAAIQRRMSAGAQLLRLERAIPRAQAEQLAAALMATGRYRYVTPDFRLRHMAVPDDTRYPEQWHYRLPSFAAGSANFEAAWDLTQGSSGVIVAVLDTGLVPHADIDTNLADETGQAVPGYDFIDDSFTANDGDGRDSDASDPGDWNTNADDCGAASPSSWHGTHVAGTIAALTGNAAGVAGGGWNARVMPVRVLGKCGGSFSDIVDAINWVASQAVPGVSAHGRNVRVINMSLGGGGSCAGTAIQDAIDNAVAAGITVAVAAGNEGGLASGSIPGNCANVITVHANNEDGGYAGYSNFGSAVEISAPGGDFDVDSGILSTLNSGTTTPGADRYDFYQGTSMATPHVAAAAALLYSVEPALTPALVLSALQTGARPFPAVSRNQCDTSDCGAGILDAAGAIDALDGLDPDGEPDPFTFTPRTDAALGVTLTSETIAVSGINLPAPISIENGSYSIGCPRRRPVFTTAPGTIENGQAVCVRHTTAGELDTTVTTTLAIGGVTGEFSSTTIPPDSTPAAFTIRSRANVPPDTVITSARATISGINAPAPVSVENGSYSVGCTATYTTEPGAILNGQRICVRHTSASDFSTATVSTLTIGGVVGTFTSTTAPPDTAPSSFSFGTVRNAPFSTLLTSSTVTPVGYNSPAPIQVLDGEYSLGCAVDGFTTASGTIEPGQSVCVRHTSAATPRTTVRTTLSIGGVLGRFQSTTPR